MKNNIYKLAQWFCRQLTSDDFFSIVNLFLEILSGKETSYTFKEKPHSENYRKFHVDQEKPLKAQPELTVSPITLDWKLLKVQYEQKHNKELKIVRRHADSIAIPDYCRCPHCNAPSSYLYLNDGKKGNQIRCKICTKLSPTHRVRHQSNAKYFCPHCGLSLSIWKKRDEQTIYKCFNDKCPHYINLKDRLTDHEKEQRNKQKYDPNFKLHYQYREYHLSQDQLKCSRVSSETKVNLSRIHNSQHVVSLVLTLLIDGGLSTRQTKNMLKGLYDIDLSHQTIINYANAAAAKISPFLDNNLPKPSSVAAADETYLIVEGKWHYTWFVIDSATKAICGYNLSDTRGTIPAIATLYDTYGAPESNIGKEFVLVRDGLPSYDSAVLAYNQNLEKSVLTAPKVIGLENLDQVSKDYRPYKQLVERLNRTYKFHTRPRAGMKSFNGALCLTTLFVAYYNYLRPHSSLKQRSPIELNELNGISLFPKRWTTLLSMC